MRIKYVLSSIAALVASLSGGSVAAQNFSVSMTGANPPISYHYTDTATCNVSNGGSRVYEVAMITIHQPGMYDVVDSVGPGNPALVDGALGLYAGAFDPENPMAHCIGSVDGNKSIHLPDGEYIAVFTTFGPGTGGEQVGFGFAGPAGAPPVTLEPYPAAPVVAAVPTLSEWAMIFLGVALAGGAALMIQRRRTA